MDGQPLTFEVFGLMKGVLTIIDRETGSVWTHLEGKAISGKFSGKRMTVLPLIHITWRDWVSSNPDTLLLSPNTRFADRYGPIKVGVYNSGQSGLGDERLPSNTLVLGVEIDGHFKAYPLEEINAIGGIINDTIDGRPLVVVYDDDAQMGLAYSRIFEGNSLEFHVYGTNGLKFSDKNTQSIWNRNMTALSGPLTGISLEYITSFISEWYGWSAYHPDTELYLTN